MIPFSSIPLRRLGLSALSAILLLTSAPAWACGGFFCFTQPVDQSAERILYVHEQGKMTVHIQISYKGDDSSFSWVLPLQKMPTPLANGKHIAVGSDTIFQLLEQSTSPSFQLNWKQNGTCYPPMCQYAMAAGGGPPNAGGGVDGVTVLAQDSAGPYDYAIVQGSSGAELVKWLNDNKYVQPQATAPLVDSYAKQSYVFLALKLSKDKGAGDLVPVSITLGEDAPCLPIRLTALATQPDMPIVAWVLDKARAIPKNYLHVELNDAAIDWLNYANNYKTVVSKAVDQGSGHAFLTELAKKTADVPIQFALPGWDAAQLAGITEPSKFMLKMFEMQLPRTAQMQKLIKQFIKKGDEWKAVSDQEFYGCIQNYSQQSSAPGDTCKKYYQAVVAAGFSGKDFAAALDEQVIKPLQNLDAQYKAAGWITRLYTTLSAEEMTKDPIFASNPDLPAVSNQHTADAEPICETGKTQATSAKITFKDGFVLTLPITPEMQNNCMMGGGPAGGPGGFGGSTVGFGKGTGALVAAGGQPLGKLQVLDEKGPPIAVDQSAADKVDAELNNAVIGKPSLSAEFLAKLPKITWNPHSSSPVATGADAGGTTGTTTTNGGSSSSSGGCNAGAVAGSSAWLMLIAAGAWIARRRRA